MYDRATKVARAIVEWVLVLGATVGREVNAWIRSGDIRLMTILVVLGLGMLLLIVVPPRRRY